MPSVLPRYFARQHRGCTVVRKRNKEEVVEGWSAVSALLMGHWNLGL